MNTVSVTVGVPTFGRGERVFATLAKVFACDPAPAEVIVHVDASDGGLDGRIQERFPTVRVLSSRGRVGPGGGRHRCIHASTQPLFVSFDDDSWPLDHEFFATVVSLFEKYPDVAVVGATIIHAGEVIPDSEEHTRATSSFAGCGYGVRVEDYKAIWGNIDRPWAYGVEEVDVSLQLFALGKQIVASKNLRVFHDTRLSHHQNPAIVAAAIENVALLAYLRYPWQLWLRGMLQTLNRVVFSVRQGWWLGSVRGIAGIMPTLFRYRRQRRALPSAVVAAYLRTRRVTG